MTQVTAILKEDIFSTFRSSVQYGKKGEKVGIVAYYGKAIIVQNKLGNKYSVSEEKLIYENVQ